MRDRIQLQLNIRSLLATAMILLLAMGLAPMARAEDIGGELGNVHWSLDGGVLTISGEGAMPDYQEFANAPWYDYADQITSIRVEEGISRIGNFAFFKLTAAQNAVLADSVTEIGSCAFFGCEKLEMLELGSGVKIIDRQAFENCYALNALTLPEGLAVLRERAFYCCYSIPAVKVPTSVREMGETVFAFCTSLRSAIVQASIAELPLWTFYGCSSLVEVTLGESVTGVGIDAFENCTQLDTAHYAGPEEGAAQIEADISDDVPIVLPNQSMPNSIQVENYQTTEADDQTVIRDEYIIHSEASTIQTDKVSVYTTDQTSIETSIEVTIRDDTGWQELETHLRSVLATYGTHQVHIRLAGTTINGADLARFAGMNASFEVVTPSNISWHFNGKDLEGIDFAEVYSLGLSVTRVSEPNEKQAAALSGAQAYTLTFDSTIEFNHEVQVPLDETLARQQASFLIMSGDAYTCAQTVVINASGAAHFYLGHTDGDQTYLVAVNLPISESGDAGLSGAIIPEEMEHEYPALETYEHVEYVVTGVKSSLGININQLTWILFGGMGACVIVVGVVVYILFKRKLAAGYVPDMSYADDPPQPKPVKKQKNSKK